MTEELTITVVECEKGHVKDILRHSLKFNTCGVLIRTEKRNGKTYRVYCSATCKPPIQKTFIPKGSEAKMIFERIDEAYEECLNDKFNPYCGCGKKAPLSFFETKFDKLLKELKKLGDEK